MTLPILILFWIGVTIIAYTYLGYGLVIYILSRLRRRPQIPAERNERNLPDITLLIAAYNEEQYVVDKIMNSLALDYPKDKLSIYFVTDGSTDSTPEIIKK